jgi:hypothetical protein
MVRKNPIFGVATMADHQLLYHRVSENGTNDDGRFREQPMTSRLMICAATAALIFASGCITVESTFKSNGMKDAAFDLQCTEDKIEMTVLNRNDGLGCKGSKVGVRGCGKQTTYECDNARNWHRSGEVSSAEGK